MKLLSAETNLESATSVGNNPLVRIYNSHDVDILTVIRKDNTGDQIGTYNVPPNKIMYCQKAYTDTLEGGAALKATAIGYSEMLDITWSGTSSSYVTEDLVFYLDAARSDSYSGSGTTWSDLSGNDFDVDALQNNTFPTFNSEGYFEFDPDERTVLECPNEAELNNAQFHKKTISVWFKTPTSKDKSHSRGISIMGGTAVNFSIYTNNAKVWLGMKTNSPLLVSGGSFNFTTDTWYNCVIVLDAEDNSNNITDGLKIYRNGTEIISTTGRRVPLISQPLVIGGGPRANDFSNNNHVIGYSNHGEALYKSMDASDPDATKSSYDGNISIVMVYNKALSADEVLQNYNAFKGRYGY